MCDIGSCQIKHAGRQRIFFLSNDHRTFSIGHVVELERVLAVGVARERFRKTAVADHRDMDQDVLEGELVVCYFHNNPLFRSTAE